LAEGIVRKLNMRLGMASGRSLQSMAKLCLRDRWKTSAASQIFIVAANLCEPINENLMELLVMIDALKSFVGHAALPPLSLITVMRGKIVGFAFGASADHRQGLVANMICKVGCASRGNRRPACGSNSGFLRCARG
jgi:hypothetical protein